MLLIEMVISLGHSKEHAERLIRSGLVTVNGEMQFIPGTKIKSDSKIEIKELNKWVSRGAFKLLKAIELFDLNFNNKIVLDIGSSTGGFTQVAIENGASKVFALDVGTNQLDYKLRSNSKVVSLEKTNLKEITPSLLQNEKIDIVVCDVSFISSYHVFASIKEVIKKDSLIVLLIKPQYEAEVSDVQKGGYVDVKNHKKIIDKVISNGNQLGFEMIEIKESPIKGKTSQNIEYLSLWKEK